MASCALSAALLSTSGTTGLDFRVRGQGQHQGNDRCWFSDILIAGLRIARQEQGERWRWRDQWEAASEGAG